MPKDNIKMVSSAEMTALWRSSEPQISQDNVSRLLVSSDAKKKCEDFINQMNYPLISRKISVRANYFYQQASNLLNTKQFDAVISFASGFSLLVYLLGLQGFEDIKLYDTDLDNIIMEREKRIKVIANKLEASILSRINNQALDLEQASLQQKPLTELFPEIKRPIFILEGLTYFLSHDCLQWLFNEMANFKQSAAIFDYWHKDEVLKSAVFRNSMQYWSDDIPETINTLFNDSLLNSLTTHFAIKEKSTLQECEASCTVDKNRILENIDQFYPVDVMTCVKESQ